MFGVNKQINENLDNGNHLVLKKGSKPRKGKKKQKIYSDIDPENCNNGRTTKKVGFRRNCQLHKNRKNLRLIENANKTRILHIYLYKTTKNKAAKNTCGTSNNNNKTEEQNRTYRRN